MFVHDDSCRRLADLEPGIHFLDLRGLLFQLSGKRYYLLLVLRDGYLQALKRSIEHPLLGGIGNGLEANVAPWRKSTRVGSIGAYRAQSPIGINHNDSRRRARHRRTKDIVDSTPVTDLAKNAVHARVVADDNIVIDAGDTRPSHATYGNVIAVADIILERLVTDGGVVCSSGVGGERFPTSGCIGAAGGIVGERKVAAGSIVGTGIVKDERACPHGGVLRPGGIEQERCRANRSIGIDGVESQRSSADAGIETASGI